MRSLRILNCTCSCPWLRELNILILVMAYLPFNCVSSFYGKWRLEHPHDAPPRLNTPPPTFAHRSA
jgi:hypothetical protein